MSDSLFSLIKALSTGEKIHFKRNAKKQAGGREPVYLHLFDLLDSMDEYDKESVLKKLRSKKTTFDYNEIRSYLKELLIDFIQEYNTERNIPRKAIRFFRKAQALYEKGLFSEAHELLKKAKELANTYQLQDALYYISTQEIQLSSGSDVQDRHEVLHIKHAERKTSIENLLIINETEEIFNSLHYLYMEAPSSRDKEVMAKAEQWFLKISSLKETSLFYPQLLRQLAASLYHNLIQQYADMHENYVNAIQLFDENPLMKERYASLYINTLKNQLASSHFHRKYEGFQHQLQVLSQSVDKLRAMFKTFPALFLSYLKLDILLSRGETEAALSYIKIQKNKNVEPAKSIFNVAIQFKQQHQYALACFLNADFKKANSYINNLINTFSLQVKGRNDILFTAKLLKLLITYELGDYLLMKDMLVATQQYFKRHEKIYDLEKIIFAHFRKIEDELVEPSVSIMHWKELKLALQSFDPFFIYEYIGFDVEAWVESKIQNRPFNQIIKEKALQYYPEIFKIPIEF